MKIYKEEKMSNLSMSLDRRFQIKQNGSTVRTEILAGITTFATMSYVLATIPNMLEQAGLVRGAVLTMLIIAVVACSVAMALYTNRPFCLAPGMSSVAILSTIDSIGMTPEVAFGIIFWEGVIFVIISFAGLRNIIATAIPASIKIALSGGIGLYIALIGLKSGGIVVSSQSNTLIFGDLSTPKALMFGIGFLLVLIFEARKIKGSMILSIIIVTIIGIPLGVTQLPTHLSICPAASAMSLSALTSLARCVRNTCPGC